MKNTKTKLSLTLSAALFVSVAFAFSDDPVSSYIFKGDIVSPWNSCREPNRRNRTKKSSHQAN
jgi:hypothetical protein